MSHMGFDIYPMPSCPDIVCVKKQGAGYNDIIFVEDLKKAIEVVDYLNLPESSLLLENN